MVLIDCLTRGRPQNWGRAYERRFSVLGRLFAALSTALTLGHLTLCHS
jgi:hypothetical protein